jgi:hypothetical protein
MRALLNETHKMQQINAVNIRDAALVSSLQRIIHHKIAGHDAIAAKPFGSVQPPVEIDPASTHRAAHGVVARIAVRPVDSALPRVLL